MKTATAPLPPLRSVKVLDQLRERIRYLHYSLRTEQAYVYQFTFCHHNTPCCLIDSAAVPASPGGPDGARPVDGC